jgi:hypothetical protein
MVEVTRVDSVVLLDSPLFAPICMDMDSFVCKRRATGGVLDVL